jgi:P-aminobenzoate N-oxygenase AurF
MPETISAGPALLATGGPDPLADWFDRAGVRKDPHRLVSAQARPGGESGAGEASGTGDAAGGEDAVPGSPGGSIGQQLRAGKTFFPASLMPYLAHPLVRDLPPERRRALAARHLYQYLTFTAHFETQVVNRAAARIATGGTHANMPVSARVDAMKIYTDESWHALYSLDLVAQLAAATGIPPLPYDFGPYLARLDAVGAELLPGRPVLAQLLQVVVFETLITSILCAVPADRSVLGVVRETVADHARDEGRHHVYFAAFFQGLWASLGPAERMAAARCLPRLIRRSLEPDLTPAGAALLAAGLSPRQASAVLAESCPKDGRPAEIARSARHSVRLFRDCGVLDVPGGRDAFAAAGLLGSSAAHPIIGPHHGEDQ